MKFTIKLAIIGCIYFFLILLFSYCKEKTKINYQEVVGFNYQFSDTTKRNMIINEFDTVLIYSFSISIHPIGKTVKIETASFDIINKCYAMNIEFKIIGNIDSLALVSDEKFNNNYNAHTSLNNIIKVRYSEENGNIVDTFEPFTEFIKRKKVFPWFLEIKFTEPPDSVRLHYFTFKYFEVGGKITEIRMKPIYIKP